MGFDAGAMFDTINKLLPIFQAMNENNLRKKEDRRAEEILLLKKAESERQLKEKDLDNQAKEQQFNRLNEAIDFSGKFGQAMSDQGTKAHLGNIDKLNLADPKALTPNTEEYDKLGQSMQSEPVDLAKPVQDATNSLDVFNRLGGSKYADIDLVKNALEPYLKKDDNTQKRQFDLEDSRSKRGDTIQDNDLKRKQELEDQKTKFEQEKIIQEMRNKAGEKEAFIHYGNTVDPVSGLAKYQMTELNKKIETFNKDKAINVFAKSIGEIKNLKTLINQTGEGAKLASSAVKVLTPRAFGEVGNLNEQEQAMWNGSQAAFDKLQAFLVNAKNSKMTKKNKAIFNDLYDTYLKSNQALLKSKLDSYRETYKIGSSVPEHLDKFFDAQENLYFGKKQQPTTTPTTPAGAPQNSTKKYSIEAIEEDK